MLTRRNALQATGMAALAAATGMVAVPARAGTRSPRFGTAALQFFRSMGGSFGVAVFDWPLRNVVSPFVSFVSMTTPCRTNLCR